MAGTVFGTPLTYQPVQSIGQPLHVIPQQIQQLHQQTQQSPFGTAGLTGLGVPQSAGAGPGWVGSQAFYPQPGQVM